MKKQKIIDGHIHFQNIEKMEKAVRTMDKLGFEKTCCMSLINTDRVNFNPEELYFKSKYPKRVYICGASDYTKLINRSAGAAKDLEDQIELLRAAGFDGVKIITGKPSYYKFTNTPFDNNVFSGFFKRLEKTNFPLLFHVGDPAEYWRPDDAFSNLRGWNYTKGGFVTFPELLRQVEAVLKKNPKLTVIFAHFMFLADNLERVGGYFKKYPNMCVDMTPGTELYYKLSENPEKAREFFIKWQDRILYGTDLFYTGGPVPSKKEKFEDLTDRNAEILVGLKEFFTTDRELKLFKKSDLKVYNISLAAPIKGIKLPKKVLDKIFFRNFERIYGKTPVGINREKALEIIESVKANAKKTPMNARTLNRIIKHFSNC